jgi:hypothetical protein
VEDLKRIMQEEHSLGVHKYAIRAYTRMVALHPTVAAIVKNAPWVTTQKKKYFPDGALS